MIEAIKKSFFQITKKDLQKAIDNFLNDYRVAALTEKNGKTLFDFIESSVEIAEEYKPTVLSPKKFFFPQEEVLVEYTMDGKVAAKIESYPMVLFGLRPCDINANNIMDEAFAESHGDANYLAKREQSIIIGMDCIELCDEDSFCNRVDSHKALSGFDIMLYEFGDKYIFECGNDKGVDFAARYLGSESADKSLYDEFQSAKNDNFAKHEGPFKDLDYLPGVFEHTKDHAIWDEEAKRCLSCGSCIMVCPTCYCFDVADELSLNLKEGQRLRRWDACMLGNFAKVAGGESFRKDVSNRVRHRINRKFNFLMRKHGRPVCVGCGRCVRACLADISPKEIVEVITGEKEKT